MVQCGRSPSFAHINRDCASDCNKRMREYGTHLLTFLFAAIPLATFLRSFLKEHLDATKDRSVGTYKAGVKKRRY